MVLFVMQRFRWHLSEHLGTRAKFECWVYNVLMECVFRNVIMWWERRLNKFAVYNILLLLLLFGLRIGGRFTWRYSIASIAYCHWPHHLWRHWIWWWWAWIRHALDRWLMLIKMTFPLMVPCCCVPNLNPCYLWRLLSMVLQSMNHSPIQHCYAIVLVVFSN